MSKSMKCLLNLLSLFIVISAASKLERIAVSEDEADIALAPQFVPCKYGVEMANGHAHFLILPNSLFNMTRQCPGGSETLTVPLPETNGTLATVCCLPDTPWKHLKTVSVKGGSGHLSGAEVVARLNATDWLSLSFPEIAKARQEKKKPRGKRSANQESSVPTPGWSSLGLGCGLLGAGLAQMIVFGLVFFTFRVTRDRIVLDCPPDLDYEIPPKPELREKSQMMSENMHSDLMSMSQAAV